MLHGKILEAFGSLSFRVVCSHKRRERDSECPEAHLSHFKFFDFTLIYYHIGAAALVVTKGHIIYNKAVDNRARFDLDVTCFGGMIFDAVDITKGGTGGVSPLGKIDNG